MTKPEIVIFNRLYLDFEMDRDDSEIAAYEIVHNLKDCGYSVVRSEFLRELMSYAREVTTDKSGTVGKTITEADVAKADAERKRREDSARASSV